jgi:hypothetical protein
LKVRAVAAYGERLLRLLPSEIATVYGRRFIAETTQKKGNWSSVPIDFATRLGLDQELREKLTSTVPNYVLPNAARTYYCSQLAVGCLAEADLIRPDSALEAITPTGLYELLTREWRDVSDIYRCAPNPDRYLHMSRSAHATSYLETLALAELALQQAALEQGSNFVASVMDRINAICDDTMSRINRSRS